MIWDFYRMNSYRYEYNSSCTARCFYEIVNIEDLIEFARSKRVYIVSPSTLYAHLQTILLSFEGHKIEEQSREVLRLLKGLQIDYEKVNDSLDILGKHIGNSSNQYSNVNKGFLGLGQKLSSVKHLSKDVPKAILDNPIEK